MEFEIKKPTKTHCDLYFLKEGKSEYVDKLYGVLIKEVPTIVAHRETQEQFEKNPTLKEYLTEFYKNWKDANSRT